MPHPLQPSCFGSLPQCLAPAQPQPCPTQGFSDSPALGSAKVWARREAGAGLAVPLTQAPRPAGGRRWSQRQPHPHKLGWVASAGNDDMRGWAVRNALGTPSQPVHATKGTGLPPLSCTCVSWLPSRRCGSAPHTHWSASSPCMVTQLRQHCCCPLTGTF